MDPVQIQHSEIYIKILLSTLTICFAVIGYFLVKTMEELRETKKMAIASQTAILLNNQRDRVKAARIKGLSKRVSKLEEKVNEKAV